MSAHGLKIMETKNGFKIIQIKTLDIRDTVERLRQKYNNGYPPIIGWFRTKSEEEKNLDQFLDTVPITSNYIIADALTLFGIDRKLYRLNTYFTESTESINNHIKVRNLTGECIIGLSEGQYQMYNDLCEQYEHSLTNKIYP
jgi:hypothetical protein